MTLRLSPPRVIVAAMFAVLFLVLCGCTQAANRQVPDSKNASQPKAYDLSADEARGGHTLKRHVGKSDSDLRSRLRMERNISAASTYTDRQTAESVLAQMTRDNQRRIQEWLKRPGGHPNLVLDYDGQQPIGRTLRREDAASHPCSHAIVVLKWLDSSDYFVLTSYPECR